MDKQTNHHSDNNRLCGSDQQLKAADQQLRASEQQLRAANQQLKAANQQLRATEEELRKSRRRYKTMFESAINAIAVYEAVDDGSDFVFRNLNPAADRMEKTKKEDLLGKSALEVLPRVKEFGLFDVLQRVWKTGKPEHYQEITHKNGHIVEWRENYVFKLPSGEIVAIYEDITERKRAEQIRQEEHNLLRTLIDNLPDSIYVKDTKSRFVIGNIEVARRAGVTTPDELIGKTDTDFYQQELALRYYADEQQVIQSGRPLINREERVINQTTGETIWNLTTKVPWRDSQGKTVGIIGMGRDITELNKTKEALKAANQQLEATNQQLRAGEQQLKAANQQLQASEQQLRAANQQLRASEQQLKAANQQLRANGQQLHAEIAERKKTEKKLLDYQGQLKSLASQLTLAEEHERHQIATELHATIGQSLAVSKLQLDALRQSVSDKKLVKTLEEVCNTLEETIRDTRTLTFDLSFPILYELGFEIAVGGWLSEQIQEKYGIATEFEDDGQPKPLDDDIRVLLFRDVRELLINVVKHASANKVKVSVRKVGSRIHFSVEDDGVGFDFTEVASIATKTGGFGLFSIRERLEQIGGELEIESEPGHGTKVTIMAPLKQGKTKDREQK